MNYQCGLDKDSNRAYTHACSPLNGYRGTHILEPWYSVHGAGLKYTKLTNSESLPDAQLMGILDNGIPLVQGPSSISVHPRHAAGRAVRNN